MTSSGKSSQEMGNFNFQSRVFALKSLEKLLLLHWLAVTDATQAFAPVGGGTGWVWGRDLSGGGHDPHGDAQNSAAGCRKAW